MTVTVSFRMSNKNSPVLQQMLRFLPSWRNAVYIPAEHFIVNCLGFFLDNCWNLEAYVIFWFVQRVGIFCTLYYHLYFPTNKSLKVLKWGKCGRRRPRPNSCPSRTFRIASKDVSVTLFVGDDRFVSWIIAFAAGNTLLHQTLGAVTSCFDSGALFKVCALSVTLLQIWLHWTVSKKNGAIFLELHISSIRSMHNLIN